MCSSIANPIGRSIIWHITVYTRSSGKLLTTFYCWYQILFQIKNEKRNRSSVVTRKQAATPSTDLSHAINKDIESAEGSDTQAVVTASDLRSLEAQALPINPKIATDFTILQQYLHDEGLHYHPPSSRRLPSSLGLEQSLYDYTDIDVLDDENQFNCNNCNKNECKKL